MTWFLAVFACLSPVWFGLGYAAALYRTPQILADMTPEEINALTARMRAARPKKGAPNGVRTN